MKTHRRRLVVCVLAAGAICAGILFRFPPDRYDFYPQCPIREHLHLLCPGCGATRALATLLHGHFSEAFHLNGFFVALLPLILTYATLSCYRAWTAQTFQWPELPHWILSAALATALLFTVVRNLLPG